jgi:hypothetical protein
MSERDTIKSVLAAMHILSAKIEEPQFKQAVQGPLEKMYLEQLQYYINRAGDMLKEGLLDAENNGKPTRLDIPMRP